MIALRLAGGLGNQIFQLGAALSIMHTHGYSNLHIFSNSLAKYKSQRSLNISEYFSIENILFEAKGADSLILQFRVPKVFRLSLSNLHFVNDSNFLKSLNGKSSRRTYLDDYFQKCLDQKSFDLILSILKDYYHEEIGRYNQRDVVVHVRGQDFVSLGWDKVTPEEYYEASIQYAMDQRSLDKIVVVTDDIPFAKSRMEKISKSAIRYISHNQKHDFLFIQSHVNRILSNSTFALWAASLANEHELNILPSLFFGDREKNFKLPFEYTI